MKRFLIVLLTVLLLATCTACKGGKKNPADTGTDYLEKLRTYESREKNPEQTTDNPDFDTFLDKVFVEGMESDFMTMHFNVVDYKKLGIEKPPVDLGELKYAFDEENYQYMEDQLKELQGFDYDGLSYRQQYDYEALEYSLYETLASMKYYGYDFLFNEGSNLAENIISNFTDYTFYDQESVEDYITCLKDYDRYLEDALTYTKEQSKDGFGLIQPWIDYTIDVCDGVLNKTDDNELIVSFNKKIDVLDFLSSEQKDSYKKENQEIVLNEVLPVYQKVKDEIGKYQTKKKLDSYVLSNIDKDYAELTYYLKSSNNKDLETVWQEMKDNLAYLEAEYVSCYYDEKANQIFADAYTNSTGSLSLTGKDCLEFLRNNLKEYYPDLGDIEYSVEELDPDTAPDNVVAYYWPSPVDNYNQNIIRTNPNNMSPGFKTYGTLSHEGFPGHLYQHVFYSKTKPHNFRSVISFIGYTEGWAVNAQYYAFRFCGVNNDFAASALFFEDAYYFLVYSIIDLGTNCFGWKAKDIVEFFNNESRLFQFDEDTANYYRNILIEMPGTFCSYGIGLSNFMTLCQNTQKTLGDRFDYVSYHEALMKNGPLPFNILQGAVDEFVATK
ncbi:MAG: DUF885 family protein [Erysipelotrichaceae bacterium]|nr:DUF885 family protein [Erysipelotrichaceae bacterium]